MARLFSQTNGILIWYNRIMTIQEISKALREAGKLKNKQDILNILRVPALRFTSDSNLRRQCDELEVIVNRWWPSIDDSAIKYVLAFADSLGPVLPKGPIELDDSTALSSKDWANYYGIPIGLLRKRLERLRKTNHDCFTQILDGERTVRQAKFLYKAKYVKEIVEGITNRKVKASTDCPAK